MRQVKDKDMCELKETLKISMSITKIQGCISLKDKPGQLSQ
jgi:hypothetical protein